MTDPSENNPKPKPPHGDATRIHPWGDSGSSTSDSETDFELHALVAQEDLPILQAVLGEYIIGERIGMGGMGQVFRATHRTMQRQVALKILPKSLSQHPELVERFYAEIRAVAKLMHPNIVTAFDAGHVESVHYLVMELIEGIPLSTKVAKQGPLTQAQVVDFLLQCSSALAYAHQRGVIHRDIKPSNLIVSHQGVLKILDFGLAQLADEVRPKVKRRQLLGTVEYMSPEQVERPDEVDHRSDLYSMGATAYFLLTGQPMFTGDPIEIALSHLKRAPTPLYEIRSEIDLRLSAIIERLVSKVPSQRYQNAQAIIENLQTQGLTEVTLDRSTPSTIRPMEIDFESITSGPQHQSTSERGYAAVGIELGAYHSRASFLNEKRELIEVPVEGTSLSLRNILWSDGERLAVGEPAMQLRASHPDQVFHGMQRWIGLPLLDRPFAGRRVPPEVLLAIVLHRLFDATRRLSAPISHAVINVPACYDQLHRTAIATACRCAGLEVLQLLDKPLAASIAHLETRLQLGEPLPDADQGEHWLVLMLSGDACEASVVRLRGLEASVVATKGEWKRGIGRWQRRLAEYLANQFQLTHEIDLREDLVAVSRLQRSCEIALDRLCSVPTVDIHYEAQQRKCVWKLDRDSLLQICGDLVADLVQLPDEAMRAAKIEPGSIRQLLLVGDMFKIPQLLAVARKSLPKGLAHAAITKSDLARGAALQAQYLMPPTDPSGPRGMSTANYDIGLILLGAQGVVGTPKILIAAGTPLPYQISKSLRFAADGSQPNTLQFVESTREGHPNWHRLGAIEPLRAFPKRPAQDPLQMRLELDLSGILNGKLTWAAGNAQAIIPSHTEPPMDPVTIQQWRDWIDTMMLCQPPLDF